MIFNGMNSDASMPPYFFFRGRKSRNFNSQDVLMNKEKKAKDTHKKHDENEDNKFLK